MAKIKFLDLSGLSIFKNKIIDLILKHTSNKTNPHGVTKAQVGLGNADNTADMDKPVSTATQAALDTKTNKSEIIPNNDLHITGAFTQNGWYRIATFGKDPSMVGTSANSCEIILKRMYNNLDNEYHHLYLSSTTYNHKFSSISNLSNIQAITKIRYVYDESENLGCIDIYYNSGVYNNVDIIINNGQSFNEYWKQTFMYVDNNDITAHATYDIPANSILLSNIDVDATPTENSTNLVASGGVYTALNLKADKSEIASIEGNISSHTHNYAGSSTPGGAANALSGFTNTTNVGTTVNNAISNGHFYVNGTSSIFGQNDGAAFVQAYSDIWVAQIYQDYRSGQIAVRGKNNGTWQSWRKILDSSNYSSYSTFNTTITAKNGINATGNITATGSINVSGVTSGSTIVVNPNVSGSYNEGIRINKASNSWAIINLGGNTGSTSGTGNGQWLIGRNPSGSLLIAENGSDDNRGLLMSGSSIKWKGVELARKTDISDTYSATSSSAMSGKAVASVISSHTHDYLPLSGGTITGDLTVSNILTSQCIQIQSTMEVFSFNHVSETYNGTNLSLPDFINNKIDSYLRSDKTDNLITEKKLRSDSISTDKLQPSCVTWEKIAVNSISDTEIQDGAVKTPKIADGAVTADKMGATEKDKINCIYRNVGAHSIELKAPDNAGYFWAAHSPDYDDVGMSNGSQNISIDNNGAHIYSSTNRITIEGQSIDMNPGNGNVYIKGVEVPIIHVSATEPTMNAGELWFQIPE